MCESLKITKIILTFTVRLMGNQQPSYQNIGKRFNDYRTSIKRLVEYT